MRGRLWRCWGALIVLGAMASAQAVPPQTNPPQSPPPALGAQVSTSQVWTWEQVKDRLELNNPTLLAGKLNISELQAQEITAHLRPNPQLTLLADQIDPFPGGPAHGPFAYWLPSATVSYLFERAHKRELRTDAAKMATAVGVSQSRIWKEIFCSICAARLCRRSRRKRCCRWRKITSSITTTC